MVIQKEVKGALLLGVALLLLVAGWYVWWFVLPVSINRRSDIKFGNTIIYKLEKYRERFKKLPETHDWQTLRKFGFKERGEILFPDYQKLNDTAFELTYVIGFDGPYLMWNSFNRKWRNDFPHFPHTQLDSATVTE